ncbi:MAG: amidohydrolase family protein, partial [Woeseiaceae bacterium]
VRELLRRTGYIWTPNIVIAGGSVGGQGGAKYYFWRELLERAPAEHDKLVGVTSAESAALENVVAVPSVPYQSHRISRVAEQVASAAKSGVRIGVSAHNMPGVGLHQEMWFMWKGGAPIGYVLRAATVGNAEKLGLHEEIGSLEPGKIGDLLVLDKNPLDDILNTLSLRYTVQGGVIYDSDTAQRVELIGTQAPAAVTGLGVFHSMSLRQQSDESSGHSRSGEIISSITRQSHLRHRFRCLRSAWPTWPDKRRRAEADPYGCLAQ